MREFKLDAGASENRCRNEINAGTKVKPARLKRNSKELTAAMTYYMRGILTAVSEF